MKTLPTLLSGLSLVSALLCAPAAMAQPVVKDGVLTSHAGMSLYSNDNDKTTPGKTVCYGPCLMLWKPYLATADAKATGDQGFITREDGSRQWTYKSMALYLWVDDKQPGDRKGDGVRSVWHLAKP
jgi:predicted lipoprotein with Yx(FWY)xxD motif